LSKIEKEYEKTPFPSSFWIFQQLLYPGLMEYIFLPLFRFKIGRKLWSVLFEFNAFYLRSVTKEENQGILPSFFGKNFLTLWLVWP